MFADYGQPSQPARPSFVEIPNPRVTTTIGRMEVTDVRSQSVTGRLLDDRDNLIQEDGHPVYTKSGLVTPVMMGIERQGRPLAIYVFMASGGSNALRGIECSAGDRMLCGRSAHENR